MTFQQFFNQFNGQFVDFDNAYGAQCFDLVNKYSTMLGYQRFTGLYASGIYNQPGSNYIQIPNSPTAVPQAGDIIVWNNNYGGGFGHTAIANGEGNTSYFVSFDQNWQPGSPAVLVKHNYNGVIGWLRPKNNAGTPAGSGEDMINQGANEYARANKLHQQVRGRALSRDVFNAFVGKSWLTYIETLSDDPEANNWQENGKVGAVARRDNWQQQIYDLQAQNGVQQKSLDEMGKQIRELQAQVAVQSDDTKLLNGFGEWLQKIIVRLGVKK